MEPNPAFCDPTDYDTFELGGQQNNQSAYIAEMLGDLLPIYAEYKQVAASVPSDEQVFVEYVSGVQKDNIKKEMAKISPCASPEEFAVLMEKARFKKVSAQDVALSDAGFAGNTAQIFKRLAAVEATFEKSHLWLVDEELLALVSVLKHVPTEQCKGVRVMAGGYYYGGMYTQVL